MRKFENQVCSYALSKELSNYSIEIEPCFYWFRTRKTSKPILVNHDSEFVFEKDKICPAYTVGELGELLLDIVPEYSVRVNNKEYMAFEGDDQFGTSHGLTEADLRAWMLLRAICCSKK
jgi:hypothetical protein